MRILFILILGMHSLVHLMGFVKAFGFYEIKALSLPISRFQGVLWLAAALILAAAALLYGLGSGGWRLAGLTGSVLSQILIFTFWQDARFGTLLNVIILLVLLVSWSSHRFESRYRADAQAGIQRTAVLPEEAVTEADLAHLPPPVQRYLRVAGVVGKPKVRNMKVAFTAEMRSKTMDWFPLTAEQHNFYDTFERLFFLKARVNGLPTPGYHVYRNKHAHMRIRLLSLFPVVDVKGDTLFEAETVTLLNDMCFLAPAALIDRRIRWEAVDSTSAKAVLTHEGVTVSATLHFNEKGELVNFVSDDRYDVNAKKKFRFSTPLKACRDMHGYHLASYGEAIWHYPEGEFVYGKYTVQDIQYNVESL